jgi:Zn ribbon nucleic-acid-binding protein
MLYYLENAKLTECMTCGHSRYKPRTGRGKTLVAYKKLRSFPITPRLQRLFMSPRTAEHMTWHQSMMKPLGLGYQKIDMRPNFCMLYYLENAKLTECMTCGHSRYKPRIGRGKTLVAYKKLRSFPITPRL